MNRFLKPTIALAGVLVVGSAMLAWAQNDQSTPAQTAKQQPLNPKDYSYALGMDIASMVQKMDPAHDINVQQLTQAITDVLDDKKPRMTAEQAAELRQQYFVKRRDELVSERKALAEKNLKQGQAFRDKNAKKAGVKTTENGLQYEVVKQGKGIKPKLTDEVTVNYKGTLIDGTEFDSSYKRGTPATFPLNQVITGWQEGLQLMPVGSTYRLVVPPELAYGAQGAGAAIGPNATLIFEVELISAKPAQADAEDTLDNEPPAESAESAAQPAS